MWRTIAYTLAFFCSVVMMYLSFSVGNWMGIGIFVCVGFVCADHALMSWELYQIDKKFKALD